MEPNTMYSAFDQGYIPRYIAQRYRPCSPEYLSKIVESLEGAVSVYLYNYDKAKDKMPKGLEETLRHCRRLCERPGLFATKGQQDAFVHAARTHISAILSAVAAREERHRSYCQHLGSLSSVWDSLTRPSYKPDRKPWEQFLDNMIGAKERSAPNNPVATLQMLPPAATELFCTWLKKNQEAMAAMTAFEKRVPPRPDKPEPEQLNEMLRKYQGNPSQIRRDQYELVAVIRRRLEL
ncbi:MAG: hypothetical protein M1823_002539 [Watsoniomyces obsoletus]|nr:MAG: hypothetical protein M1823_002539 [Watsoniomyces obsoletus]